jgi:hypothetical protein
MFYYFAPSTKTATDIGTFTIPSGANVDYFAYNACSLTAKITISVSSGKNVFLSAATLKDTTTNTYLADITLIPTSDAIKSSVITNFVNVYGLSGTSSVGNIHI